MLCNFVNPADIKLNLESTEKEECLAELLEVIVARQPMIKRSEVISSLILREEKSSTAVFPGIAIPHIVCESISKPCIAIGISRYGVDFDSKKVNVIFEILFRNDDAEFHMQVLKDIVNLVNDNSFVNKVINAKSSQDVFDAIVELETQTV